MNSSLIQRAKKTGTSDNPEIIRAFQEVTLVKHGFDLTYLNKLPDWKVRMYLDIIKENGITSSTHGKISHRSRK